MSDADLLVTGRGLYTADRDAAGALHGAFVRADRAHAGIRGVDAEAARAMPGVRAVLTARDLPTFGAIPAFLRQPTVDGRPLVVPRRPILAEDRVRHVGELVALVVAESEAAALDAAEAVIVDYADLPVVVGLDAALAADAPDIHPEAPGNRAATVALGDHAAVEAAFAAAADVVALTLELPRLAPAPMENRCVLASYDATSGRFRLATPHQGIVELRRDLSAALGVPGEAIAVEAEHVGGAFGARGAAYPEHAALLAAAKALGRPVRWQASRLESFLSDYHGRGTRLAGRLALDAQGRFTAIEVALDADLGAYVNPVGAHIHVANPSQTLTGCYRIPAAAATFRLAFTNATPVGPYRGAGRPDIAYLVERLVDEAAARRGVDRLALRRENALRESDFPYETPLVARYDSGDYADLVARAEQAADWSGFPARRDASAGTGRLRGIGASLFVEVAGGGPVPRDEVRLTLARDGATPRLVVETTSKSTGQGHAETYAAIVADRLGISPDAISLVESPSDTPLVGAGSFASRSTAAVGAALVDACDRLAERLRALVAARQGEADDALVVAGRAIARRDGAPVTTLAEALAEAARGEAQIAVLGAAPVAATFPSGCHVAEVEIDRQTGVVRLLRYVAIDDSGNVLSPARVEGQIMGGAAQGIGGALVERFVSDADGQAVTSSLMDYALPRADDLPSFLVETRASPSPTNPLGVKGVGEAGTTGALGAVANAVMDALRPAGVTALDIPFTPARVWAALEAARHEPSEDTPPW